MKWTLLIVGVVLAVAGGWYYLNNRSVIQQINKQEPGFETRYTHGFTGTYLSLDSSSGTMHLRGSDDKEYLFRIPQAMIDNRDVDVVGNAQGQRLVMEWNDVRSPAQVLEDYASDPTLPLNEGTALVSIRGIHDEE